MRKVFIKYVVFVMLFIYSYLFMALPTISYDKVDYKDDLSFDYQTDNLGRPIWVRQKTPTERFLGRYKHAKMPKLVFDDFIKSCNIVYIDVVYNDAPISRERFECDSYLKIHNYVESRILNKEVKSITVRSRQKEKDTCK